MRLIFCVLMLVALSCAVPQLMVRRRGMPSICLQPPPRSEGICTLEIEGYYFDTHTNDCEMYVVGGCRSYRGQSFSTRQDCLATCVHGTRRIQDLRINE